MEDAFGVDGKLGIATDWGHNDLLYVGSAAGQV